MNNKHDANVRKSTLVNFQLGLIVALVITVLVMEIKSPAPTYNPEIASAEDTDVEIYFNPDYVIETNKIKEIKKEERKIQKIINEIDVIKDDTPDDLFKDTELTTEPVILDINPGDLVEKPVADDIPVPFIKVEQVPIFPGCEGLDTNEARRDCMSNKINKLVQKKFDAELASDLGLQGKQRIYVQFRIDKQGNVTQIQSRSTHPQLTKEGERMASLIPQMLPGMQRDKPVEVIFNLPIVFDVKN